jgi:HAD superfamily phosphoserine phosphatase-like hydrolase
MKYKGFTAEIWDKIREALDQELKESTQTPVAAFDADGTLWDADLGENFFRWQIQNHVLENLPDDPWRYYRHWKNSGDPRPAYLWLAQINQGHSLEEVSRWAEEACQSLQPFPVFEDQQKLIELLQAHKVQVYVVTASVKWSVIPGAKRLGIPAENILGVATKVNNGIITTEQEGPITYREGKLKALLEKTKGFQPFFASGNTMGDYYLLSGASLLALAVGAASENDELFKNEDQLRQESRRQGWLSHRF